MRRSFVIVAALAAVAVVVALVARSSSAPTAAPARLPFRVGFNESLAQTHRLRDPARWRRLVDLDARLHHDVGSSVLRTVLHWDATEPTPGHFDFSLPDQLVSRYGAAGVQLLFVLDGVPRWAGHRLAPWRAWVRAVVARYSGRIAGLDVFNEPNLRGSAIEPERYAQLLCAAHQAAGRRVPIGGGALAAGLKTTPLGMSLPTYLVRMLRAGAGRCLDAISFHPYPDGPGVESPRSAFQRTFAIVRGLRDRFAPGKPLWVTETGWRAQTGPEEWLQARVLVRILHVVEDMRPRDVRMLIFHTLVGDPAAPGGPDYGIVSIGPEGGLRPRPAYRALAHELR